MMWTSILRWEYEQCTGRCGTEVIHVAKYLLEIRENIKFSGNQAEREYLLDFLKGTAITNSWMADLPIEQTALLDCLQAECGTDRGVLTDCLLRASKEYPYSIALPLNLLVLSRQLVDLDSSFSATMVDSEDELGIAQFCRSLLWELPSGSLPAYREFRETIIVLCYGALFKNRNWLSKMFESHRETLARDDCLGLTFCGFVDSLVGLTDRALESWLIVTDRWKGSLCSFPYLFQASRLAMFHGNTRFYKQNASRLMPLLLHGPKSIQPVSSDENSSGTNELINIAPSDIPLSLELAVMKMSFRFASNLDRCKIGAAINSLIETLGDNPELIPLAQRSAVAALCEMSWAVSEESEVPVMLEHPLLSVSQHRTVDPMWRQTLRGFLRGAPHDRLSTSLDDFVSLRITAVRMAREGSRRQAIHLTTIALSMGAALHQSASNMFNLLALHRCLSAMDQALNLDLPQSEEVRDDQLFVSDILRAVSRIFALEFREASRLLYRAYCHVSWSHHNDFSQKDIEICLLERRLNEMLRTIRFTVHGHPRYTHSTKELRCRDCDETRDVADRTGRLIEALFYIVLAREESSLGLPEYKVEQSPILADQDVYGVILTYDFPSSNEINDITQPQTHPPEGQGQQWGWVRAIRYMNSGS